MAQGPSVIMLSNLNHTRVIYFVTEEASLVSLLRLIFPFKFVEANKGNDNYC